MVERVRIIQDERHLSLPELWGRDIGVRFSDREKLLLAGLLMEAWTNSEGEEMEGLSLDLDARRLVGSYGNGMPDLRIATNGITSELIAGRLALVKSNLNTLDEVRALSMTTLLLGKGGVHLVTADLPAQLNERAVLRPDGTLELPMMMSVANTIANSGIKRATYWDGHSPATSWWLGLFGVAGLDLTVIPAMLSEAERKGWLEGGLVVDAACDDGATERALLVNDMLSMMLENQVVLHLQGEKDKSTGITKVAFTAEALEAVNGKVVVIAEDRILSGGTLVSVIENLLNHGALRVVVLAPYGEFIEGSVGKLMKLNGHTGKVLIMTTDAFTPMSDVSSLKGVMCEVETMHLLGELEKFHRAGVNPFSDEGKEILLGMGLALNPWQTHAGRRHEYADRWR